MESKILTLRVPEPLLTAAESAAKAAGLSLGEWARSLMEQATGVSADPKQGFAALSPTKRKRISRAGVKARRQT